MQLAFGIATGLLAAGSAVVLFLVPWWHTPLAAILFLGLVVAVSFGWARLIARREQTADVPSAVSGAMLGTALSIAYAVFSIFVRAKIDYPLVALMAVMLAALGRALGWFAADAGAPTPLSLRRLAVTAVGACGVLALAGVTAAARPHEVRDYELVDELVPLADQGGGFVENRGEHAHGTHLGRTCIHNLCYAHVKRDDATFALGPAFAQGAALRLLHSQERETLLLEVDGKPTAITAIGRHDSWWQPTLVESGAWLAAMPALAALAGFGFVAALLALVLCRLVVRRIGHLSAAPAGIVAQGWLRLAESSSPTRVANHVTDGPVLVTGALPANAIYRGSATDTVLELVVGERDAMVTRLLERARTLDAIALSVAVCFVAPLVAALVSGSLLH